MEKVGKYFRVGRAGKRQSQQQQCLVAKRKYRKTNPRKIKGRVGFATLKFKGSRGRWQPKGDEKRKVLQRLEGR